MATREREVDNADRMSEHEALMWSIEKDPWLNPSGGSIVLLDQPVDPARFMRQMRAGIARTPRLYQRAVPGFGRISTPAWVPDAEFDINAHVREVVLPGPGTDRQLLDLAARLYLEPLDRTRPLWRFVLISGLEGGRGALWAIIHHSVADGIGQMRMAEMYQDLERDAPPAPEVDLKQVIDDAVAAHQAKESGGNTADSVMSTLRNSASHLARRQWGIGRRMAGEVALWPADPRRINDTVGVAVDTVKAAARQLSPSSERSPASRLWSDRSRHRHLEWVRVDVDELKAAGKALGGSINDAFLAGLVEGVHRYHVEHDTPIESTNTSFVLSTRSDGKAGGNSFTPRSSHPSRRADVARRAGRCSRQCDCRGQRRGTAHGWHDGAVGRGEPLADLGRDPSGSIRSAPHRLCDIELARRSNSSVLRWRQGARHRGDGAGRGNRRKHHGDVLRRGLRHGHLRRPRGHHRPDCIRRKRCSLVR